MQRVKEEGGVSWKTDKFFDKAILKAFPIISALGILTSLPDGNFPNILAFSAFVFLGVQTIRSKSMDGNFWIFEKWWQKTDYVLSILALVLFCIGLIFTVFYLLMAMFG